MFNRIELVIGGLCVVAMASALYLVQGELRGGVVTESQTAQTVESGLIAINTESEEINNEVNISRMVIDDIKEGSGEAVKDGDTVSVHYAGSLQDGQEFDNSRLRGAPFEFTVGAGMVIKGWEEGLVGMKAGGERVLVIPPEKAYGENGIGPIPPNSTLVFKIELIEIK